MRRFSSVILDVDSTLSGIEGIDWIAARRNPEVARQVARLTAEAMSGRRTLNEVYGARLGAVKPTAADLADLAEAYWDNAAPGAADAIGRMLAAGVRLDVVTSGFHDAIAPFAARLGLPKGCVHAVRVSFDSRGNYSAFDAAAPLVVQGGKRIVAEALRLKRPVLAVGDGVTDAEIRPVADAFAAYTGFVRRDSVVAIADFTVGSFAEVERLVLATEDPA
ncbi:MAG: HAD-IB family phosphatase [Gemmatimonadaceae bacterium]